MKLITYFHLKNILIDYGYLNELRNIQNILNKPFPDAKDFLFEYIWVVVNSGMKNQIADKIYKKIITAIYTNTPVRNVFGHIQKTEAIEYVYRNIFEIYDNLQKSEDKIEFLDKLPFMGPATKYHLARNLGIDVCKPDRHLLRIAKKVNSNPYLMCKSISQRSGDKIGFVDIVIWRAANLGFI